MTGMYWDKDADGTAILTVSRGICPPVGPIVHVCDAAAQSGLALLRWWEPEALLDEDGNCRYCGERV